MWRRVLASIGTLSGAAASGASGAEASAEEPLSGQPRTWQRVAVQAASASGQAYRCNTLHRLDQCCILQVVLVAMVKVADNVTSALPADRCIGVVRSSYNSGNRTPENLSVCVASSLCRLPTSLYAGRHAGDVFSRGLLRAFQPRLADITPGVAVAAELAAVDEEPLSPVVRWAHQSLYPCVRMELGGAYVVVECLLESQSSSRVYHLRQP